MRPPIRITDVSPRDGLQNESGVIPTKDKVRLVEFLAASGVDEIEVTSFVSPKWVPQLGDASELLSALATPARKPPPLHTVLIPNAKGLEAALSPAVAPAIDGIAVFTAASETFSRKNTNASIAETIERFRPVIETAHNHHWPVRGYISTVIACPFEGPIAPSKVAEVARLLIDLGVDELDLGDTIGAATPESTQSMLAAVAAEAGKEWLTAHHLTLHLHDTFGRAAECVKAALDFGVRSFDGSVAGLGGCPYAGTPGKRAPGNISTELLVRTIEDAGFKTNVDMDKLAIAADYARTIVAASRVRSSGGGEGFLGAGS